MSCGVSEVLLSSCGDGEVSSFSSIRAWSSPSCEAVGAGAESAAVGEASCEPDAPDVTVGEDVAPVVGEVFEPPVVVGLPAVAVGELSIVAVFELSVAAVFDPSAAVVGDPPVAVEAAMFAVPVVVPVVAPVSAVFEFSIAVVPWVGAVSAEDPVGVGVAEPFESVVGDGVLEPEDWASVGVASKAKPSSETLSSSEGPSSPSTGGSAGEVAEEKTFFTESTSSPTSLAVVYPREKSDGSLSMPLEITVLPTSLAPDTDTRAMELTMLSRELLMAAGTAYFASRSVGICAVPIEESASSLRGDV